MYLIFLCVSCRKDPDVLQFRFTPLFENGKEPIKYDSIAHTTIIYSDMSELPDSHTVNMNIRNEYLSLISGHSYSFKKFDMVGKSGKVLYYIPSRGDTTSGNIYPRLPINFTIPEDGANLVVNVVLYPY
jgi:hypothetical protein